MATHTMKDWQTDLHGIDKFIYLDSILSIICDVEKVIESRLDKARNAYRNMTTVWKFSQYTINTKVKLYKICNLPVLLCVSKCWKVTEQNINELSEFIIRSL